MVDEVYIFYIGSILIIATYTLIIVAWYSFLMKLNQITLGVAKYYLKEIESYK